MINILQFLFNFMSCVIDVFSESAAFPRVIKNAKIWHNVME